MSEREPRKPACSVCLNWADKCLCPMRNYAEYATFHSSAARIVAAAVRHENCFVYAVEPPARHHNVLAMMRHRYYRDTSQEYTQGFLVSDGRFVDRDEARTIAYDAGQVDKMLLGGVLTSEDLW